MTLEPNSRWAPALGRDYTHGNAVRTLIDGTETFRAMFDAIQTAQGSSHFIYLLAWWLEDDLPLAGAGSDLRHLLESKARAGVQIRVMLWLQPFRDAAGHDTPEQIKFLIEAETDPRAGLEAVGKSVELMMSGRGTDSHFAIAKWINGLRGPDGKQADAAAIVDWLTGSLAGSHHQKMLCVRGVQGVVSLCGGVDVNTDRMRARKSGKGEPLHDVHCQVRGPAATDLVSVFVQRWDSHPDSRGLDGEPGRRGLLGRSLPSTDDRNRPGAAVRVVRTFNLVKGGKYALKRDPCKLERTMKDALLHAIPAATRFIYFEDQYMVSLTVADELARALPHVQHVTALVTDASISDLPQVWIRRKEFIDRATKRGSHKNFHVYYLVDPAAGRGGPRTYVHAKTWIFDDELAYVGSANVNNRGLSSDSEVGVFVYDGAASIKPPYNIVQSLRIRLWEQHLGMTVVDGTIGFKAGGQDVGSRSRVRPYNPDEDKDPLKYRLPLVRDLLWELADPDLDGLPACHRVQPARLRQLGAVK